jgi:hypothetical protein
MYRPDWLELSIDERPFDRRAFKRILKARFGVDEFGDGAPESRVPLPIGSERVQVGFQAAFFFTPPADEALDRVVHQLIDRATFDLAQARQRGTLFSVNSQSEGDSSHGTKLSQSEGDVNLTF